MSGEAKDRLYSGALVLQLMFSSIVMWWLAAKLRGDLIAQTLIYAGAALLAVAVFLAPLVIRMQRRPFARPRGGMLLFTLGVPVAASVFILWRLG